MVTRKRGSIETIYNLLVVIRNKNASNNTDNGALKSYLMLLGNVNSSSRYFSDIVESGLARMENVGRSKRYWILEKGKTYIDKFEELEQILG